MNSGARLAAEPDGLEELLGSLQADVRDRRSLAAQADVVLTLGGRVPVERGRRGLTPHQRALLAAVGDDVRADDGSCDADDAGGTLYELGATRFGRIVLGSVPAGPSGCIRFGTFRVPASHRTAICARAEVVARDEDLLPAVDAWFAATSDADVAAAVRGIATALDRTDPVLIFVGDRSFGCGPEFERARDEHPSPWVAPASAGAFLALAKRPADAWHPTERILVHALHHLLRAGFRGEELNGVQATPAAVHAVLDAFGSEMARAGGAGDRPPDWPEQLDAKADAVARLRAGVVGRGMLFRVVDGLTLHKSQHVLDRPPAALAPQELPPPVQSILRRAGLEVGADRDLDAIARAFVARALGAARGGPDARSDALHPVEELLLALAAGAADALRADIAMTRCVRDLGALAGILAADRGEVAMGWPTSEFFCAVAADRRLAHASRGPAVPLARALRAISTRMCFNSWHYLPGYFDPARIPPGRHMYVPPRMPDLSSWSDFRHAGHRAARVRYAIRAPGPVRVHGQQLDGLYDLRLMRCAGEPFGLDDLRLAVAYARVLGAVYQALADHAVTTGAAFRVTAFTDAWYDAAHA